MATFVVGFGGELEIGDEVGIGDTKDRVKEEGDHASAVRATPAMEVNVFLIGIGEKLEDLWDGGLRGGSEEGIISDYF